MEFVSKNNEENAGLDYELSSTTRLSLNTLAQTGVPMLQLVKPSRESSIGLVNSSIPDERY